MAQGKTEPNTTAKRQRDFVHALILKIANASNVTLPLETQAIYLEQLIAIEPAELAKGVSRVLVEWAEPSKMPPLKFVLDRCQGNLQLQSEQAWEALRMFQRKHWHPDIGFLSDARLDPATEYAVRQCGGLQRINDATDESFSFIRRDFLAAFIRYQQEGGEQEKLSHELAASTLKQLKAGTTQLSGKRE